MLAADEEKVDGKSLIDCGFTAHPSLLSVPNDMEKVKKPLSVAIRGSKEDPEENELGQQAEDQALAWFEKWLVNT